MVLSHPSHPSHPSSKVTVGDQNTKIISRRFVDIDDFTQQMQSFSQVCMTQLSLHSLQSDVWLAALGGVQFVFIKSSCPIFISGDKPRDAIAFACLLEPTGPPIISHGRPMAHQTLGGFDPTREAKFVLPSQAYYVAFQIQRDLLHQYLQIMGRFDLDERFWRTNYISLPETITSVKNYLNQILYLIQHQSSLLRQSHIKTLLMDDFIPLLINAIPPGSPEERDLPLPMSRSLLVEQAHD